MAAWALMPIWSIFRKAGGAVASNSLGSNSGPTVPGFNDIHGAGEAGKGLVIAEVSGMGEVTTLVIAPKAMRVPSAELAHLVRSAVNAALSAAREQAVIAAAALPAPPDLERLTTMIDELSLFAERRMQEFASAAVELSARLDPR